MSAHFWVTDTSKLPSPKEQELLNLYAEGGFRKIVRESPDIANPIEFITACEKTVGSDKFSED